MDSTVVSGVATGGIGGVVFGVAFLLYKCLQGKHLLSKCCGAELDISNDKEPATTVQIVTADIPHSTPALGPQPAPERRLSVVEV